MNENNKKTLIGGLVGDMNGGRIENCHVKGSIISTSNSIAGGLAGRITGDSVISDSSADVDIIIIDVDNIFDSLMNHINEKVKNVREKNELLTLVSEMENSKGDRGRFKVKYDEFISKASNYTTLISAYSPYLMNIWQ